MTRAEMAGRKVAAIVANVDAFYSDRITIDEFRVRNRALWASIEVVPWLHEMVSDMLRAR